jgi:DNA-cytosine methyltransferase
VEIDPYCQQVLKKHYPKAQVYGDIKTFNGKEFGGVDILTGGFPCQPFSSSGKRKGNEDARHLWPEMLRIIREVKPRYIVGENVLGILNWSGGLVFDEVCADLEREGYEVIPVVLPASAKNAVHRRYRVWFVAHAISDGLSWRKRKHILDEAPKRQAEVLYCEKVGQGDYIPESRLAREDNGLPNRMDRTKGLGNAWVPHVAAEIMRGIKEIQRSKITQ